MGQSVFQKFAGLSGPRPGGAGVSVFSRFEKLSAGSTILPTHLRPGQLLHAANDLPGEFISPEARHAAKQALRPARVPDATAVKRAPTPTVPYPAPRMSARSIPPESVTPSPYASPARDSHFPPGIPDAPVDVRAQQPTGSFASNSSIPADQSFAPFNPTLNRSVPPDRRTFPPMQETPRGRGEQALDLLREYPELAVAGAIGTGAGGYGIFGGNDEEKLGSVFSKFGGLPRPIKEVADKRISTGAPLFRDDVPGYTDAFTGYDRAEIERYAAGKQNARQIAGARQMAQGSGSTTALEHVQNNLISPHARSVIPEVAAPSLGTRLQTFKQNKIMSPTGFLARHAKPLGLVGAGAVAGLGLGHMLGGPSQPQPYAYPYGKTGSHRMSESVFNKFAGLSDQKISVFAKFGGIKEAGSQQRKVQRRAEKIKANQPKGPMIPVPKRTILETPAVAAMPIPHASYAAPAEEAAEAAAKGVPRSLLRRALVPLGIAGGVAGLGYGLYRNNQTEPALI